MHDTQSYQHEALLKWRTALTAISTLRGTITKQAHCVVYPLTSFFAASLTIFLTHMREKLAKNIRESWTGVYLFTALCETSYGGLYNMQPAMTSPGQSPSANHPQCSLVIMFAYRKYNKTPACGQHFQVFWTRWLECGCCVSACVWLSFNVGQTLTSSAERLPQ